MDALGPFFRTSWTGRRRGRSLPWQPLWRRSYEVYFNRFYMRSFTPFRMTEKPFFHRRIDHNLSETPPQGRHCTTLAPSGAR